MTEAGSYQHERRLPVREGPDEPCTPSHLLKDSLQPDFEFPVDDSDCFVGGGAP